MKGTGLRPLLAIRSASILVSMLMTGMPAFCACLSATIREVDELGTMQIASTLRWIMVSMMSSWASAELWESPACTISWAPILAALLLGGR